MLGVYIGDYYKDYGPYCCCHVEGIKEGATRTCFCW